MSMVYDRSIDAHSIGQLRGLSSSIYSSCYQSPRGWSIGQSIVLEHMITTTFLQTVHRWSVAPMANNLPPWLGLFNGPPTDGASLITQVLVGNVSNAVCG